MRQITILMVGLMVGGISSVQADTQKANPYKDVLASVPAPELPGKAAEVVKQAKVRQWGTTTVSVVKAALEANPVAAPAVAAAIAHSVPDMAAIAAGTAAEAQPKQAILIAKAAATAAPGMAGKVVASVCRAVPTEYRAVALAVAEAVPGSNKEVLKAVAAVFPEMRSAILSAMGDYSSGLAPVATVLDHAASASGVASGPSLALPRAPTVFAPPVPPDPTPTPGAPTSGGSIVPPGGRNYARP